MARSTRREFLDYLTKLGVCLPILPSLAEGGTGPRLQNPKRLIVVCTGNGQYADHWYPKNVELRPMGDRCHGASLDSIQGPISKVIDKTFDRFRSKMCLIRGLDLMPLDTPPHGMTKMLNGVGDEIAPTLDQLIAESAAMYQSSPFLRSLHLKNRGITEGGRILSVHPKFGRVFPIDRVELAYAKVFHQYFRSPLTKELLDRNYTRQIARLAVSPEDRDRLRQHLELLRGFGTRPMSCPTITPPGDLSTDRSRLIAYTDLIVAAVKCDLTRVITFNLTESADEKFMPYTGMPGGFHAVTHVENEGWALDSFLAFQKFHAEIVVDLLEKLDIVEDSATGRTFLDNSLVLWIGEQAVRQGDTSVNLAHDSSDLPLLMIGSLGGILKTGMFFDFQTKGKVRERDNGKVLPEFPFLGRAINEWQISIMTAMGLSREEWELNGKPGFGSYENNVLDQYKIGTRDKILTQLFA